MEEFSPSAYHLEWYRYYQDLGHNATRNSLYIIIGSTTIIDNSTLLSLHKEL